MQHSLFDILFLQICRNFQAFFVRSFRIIKRRYIRCSTAFNFEFCPYNFTIIDRMEFCNFIINEVFIDCKKYSPHLAGLYGPFCTVYIHQRRLLHLLCLGLAKPLCLLQCQVLSYLECYMYKMLFVFYRLKINV